MSAHTFTVNGNPAPQGSKRVGRNRATGRAVLIESSTAVKPWRKAIADAWHAHGYAAVTGPVRVEAVYYLPRPKGHYGTGRNAGTLRPSAPRWPAVKPDVDKLDRACLDALTQAGAIDDDARVVALAVLKRYADDHPVGARITIAPMTDTTTQEP